MRVTSRWWLGVRGPSSKYLQDEKKKKFGFDFFTKTARESAHLSPSSLALAAALLRSTV